MDQPAIVVVAVGIAILVIAAVAWFLIYKRRSRQLRQRFGPEYDRVVQQEGDVHRAEGVLQWREKRREQLDIGSLSPTDRSDFAERWRKVQSQFVDDPKGAVTQADRLVSEVMQSRGYPVADFDQRAADISVDHPIVVENYRNAHDETQVHS